MEAPDGLVLWGYRAWSKSHQAFYDKAFEGVCLLKKEGQVLLRSAKHLWFLQYLVKKFFCITLYQKCQKACVEHETSPRITILWLSGTCLGAAPPFCWKTFFLSQIWACQGAGFDVAPCSSICLKQEVWLCHHCNFSPSEGVVFISS